MRASGSDLRSALALVTSPAHLKVPRAYNRPLDEAIARTEAWSVDPCVQGFGTAQHTVAGRLTGEHCLRVYVDRMDHASALNIPSQIEIPWTRGRVPVEIHAIGQLSLTSTLEGVIRPARPGCAISTPGRSQGSFGCVVRDSPPHTGFYILSAAHVIANSTFDPLGTPVLQPGPSDAGEVIGFIARWGALEFTHDTFPNLFEAAIARVEQTAVRPDIFELGRPTGLRHSATEHMRVTKCGSRTEVTRGEVVDANFHCSFHFLDPNGTPHRAGFQQQILCKSLSGGLFSDGGDSGAAVLDESNRVLGLIVGAAAGGTVVSPIGPILQSLKVILA